MAKTIKYRKVNKLKDEDFKRDTFKEMVKIIRRHYRQNKIKGGTTKSLSANDETLMMLEYYREYRIFCSIITLLLSCFKTFSPHSFAMISIFFGVKKAMCVGSLLYHHFRKSACLLV